jgi:hypothetical protein
MTIASKTLKPPLAFTANFESERGAGRPPGSHAG